MLVKRLLIKTLIASLLTFLTTNCFGQSVKELARSCDSVFNELSIGWKQDSNTTTGYRLQNFKRILACQVFCMDSSYVLSKLGRPDEILDATTLTVISYYLYDGRQFPKDKSIMVYGLSFYYDKSGQFLWMRDVVFN